MSDVTATEVTGENPLGLAFADIENAVKIIDYACDQGSFKGWDTIKKVFEVRERLASFVEAAQAQSGDAPDAAAPEAQGA